MGAHSRVLAAIIGVLPWTTPDKDGVIPLEHAVAAGDTDCTSMLLLAGMLQRMQLDVSSVCVSCHRLQPPWWPHHTQL